MRPVVPVPKHCLPILEDVGLVDFGFPILLLVVLGRAIPCAVHQLCPVWGKTYGGGFGRVCVLRLTSLPQKYQPQGLPPPRRGYSVRLGHFF